MMHLVPVATDAYRAIASPVVLPVASPSMVQPAVHLQPAVVQPAVHLQPAVVQPAVTPAPTVVQAAVTPAPAVVQAAVPTAPAPVQTLIQTSDSVPPTESVVTGAPEQVAADAAKEALVAKEEMMRNAEVQDVERKVALDEFEKAESSLERAKQDYDAKSEALFRETREADRAAETALEVSLSSEEAERYAEEAKKLSGGVHSGGGDGDQKDGEEGDRAADGVVHESSAIEEGEHWFMGILKHPFTWIVLSLLVAAIVFSIFFHNGSDQKKEGERRRKREQEKRKQQGTTLILEWDLGRDPVHEDKLFAINSDSQSFVCSLKEVFKGQKKKARILVPGEDAAVRAVLKDGTQQVCSLNESNKITFTEDRSSVCSTTTEKEEDVPLQEDAMKPYVE